LWKNWSIALRVLYGLPVKSKYAPLIKECTGRDINLLPKNGFDTALFLIGRRSGKSRIAAVIAAFESTLSEKENLLSRGELGMVAVISPTKLQSQIVKSYLRAIFDETPLLQNEVVQEDRGGFELSNKIRIQILTGDYKSVRGFSLVCCVAEELSFFGLTEESVKSDVELVRAVKPGLATTKGRLIGISSPYAKKGYCFNTHKKNFGNDSGKVLVWNCPSRTMNPTLPQSVVDEAMQEDLQSALSEYGGQFREDVAIFLPREVIEGVVKPGRVELLPYSDIDYFGFCDVSGGRSEDAGLSIAHRTETKVVIDFVKRYKSPHSPQAVISLMADELRRYGLGKVTGDNYSAEFVVGAFKANGISYEKSKLPKSALYLELLPRICSGQIELLDNEVLVNQLANLERRTVSGGKDKIDHPTNGKDDLANAVAGASFIKRRSRIGGFGGLSGSSGNINIRKLNVLT